MHETLTAYISFLVGFMYIYDMLSVLDYIILIDLLSSDREL